MLDNLLVLIMEIL